MEAEEDSGSYIVEDYASGEEESSEATIEVTYEEIIAEEQNNQNYVALDTHKRISLLESMNRFMFKALTICTRDQLTMGQACWVAYYSMDKRGYPFGDEEGRPTVHDDVLNFLQCSPYHDSQEPYEALLAHQFMTRKTRKVSEWLKAGLLGRSIASAHCVLIVKEMEELPRSSQQYLEEWKRHFVDRYVPCPLSLGRHPAY